MEKEEKRALVWERVCYVLLVGIGLVLFASWLDGSFEVVSGLMFGFFIMWQVVRGLVIKRYFWHIPEEKVSFWSLLLAFFTALLCYYLCHK